MLPRDTPTLPDDSIQVAGSGEFCAFSACDALRQMGEEGERPSPLTLSPQGRGSCVPLSRREPQGVLREG